MARARKSRGKTVEILTHGKASRKNIPTAEYQALLNKEDQGTVQVAYERRNRDLDPQLVWRGKDVQDWSDLVVQAPPLFIQEKVHPKALIDDLLRRSKQTESEKAAEEQGSRPTCSRISTACPPTMPKPSSTSTTPTGRSG